MNLPNKISLLRILLVPIFLIFAVPVDGVGFLSGYNNFIHEYGCIIAGVIYIIASATDSIDGRIARGRNLVTKMGKFLDPIADKLLVTSAVLVLVQRQQLSSWLAMIIIGRELIITGFRLVASGDGVVIAANNLGKVKMVAQTIAISWMLFEPKLLELLGNWYKWEYFITPGSVFILISAVLTVISGYVYIRDNIHIIKNEF